MIERLRYAARETVFYLFLAFKALAFWRKKSPVTNVEELIEYVETRAKFVAQTTLFGYVRTRAGTRYTSLFDDDIFARSLNIAKWEIYLACLCDLAVYTSASVDRQTRATDDDIGALAVYVVDTATWREEIPPERPQGFEDIRVAFHERVPAIDWHAATDGDTAFRHSLDALVQWAPVADELKVDDVQIVENSMRFKWKQIRDQFAGLLDAEAVMADWHSQTDEKIPDAHSASN